MFSQSDSKATEEVYLEGLKEIQPRGIRIKAIRTDDFTTFKSRKVRTYYSKHGIERQSSTSYQHWQNSVERDIQTMNDTQHISRHPQIATHACRLLEPSA